MFGDFIILTPILSTCYLIFDLIKQDASIGSIATFKKNLFKYLAVTTIPAILIKNIVIVLLHKFYWQVDVFLLFGNIFINTSIAAFISFYTRYLLSTTSSKSERDNILIFGCWNIAISYIFYIGGIISIAKYCAIPINHIFINLLAYIGINKMIGNFSTKIGDIISDYDTKIKEDGEEDKTENTFSEVDNIGDVIGDLYSNFFDFVIVTVFILNFVSTSNYFDAFNIGLHVNKAILLCMITYLLNSIFGIHKTLKNVNNIVLLSSTFMLILEIFLKIKVFNINIGILKSVIQHNLVLFILLSMNELSGLMSRLIISPRAILNYFINLYQHISIFLIPVCCVFTMLVGFVLSSYSQYMFVLFSKHFLFNIYSASQQMLLNLPTIIAAYLFKVSVGVVADSACGIYKKAVSIDQYKHINRSKITEKNNQILDNEIEEYLDSVDECGNFLKMESRIFLFSITFLLFNMCIYNGVKINLVINFLLTSVLTTVNMGFIICLYNNYKNRANRTFVSIIQSITGYASVVYLILFGIICISYQTQNQSNAFIVKSFPFTLSLFSLFGAYLGGVFDIVKKHVQLHDNKNIEIKDLIKYDLLGDHLKDVFAPTLFTLSYLAAFFVF